MGSQGPLGCAKGFRRTVTPLQLPSACLRGSNCLKTGCLRRRLTCRPAAIGFSEILAGPWSDHESVPGSLPQDAELLLPSSAGQHQGHRQHSGSQVPQPDQLRSRHQQKHRTHQQEEAAQQLVQHLVPTPIPVASATKLHARGGVSGIGVVLGILLTVALQLVGRWLLRQRWAQQLVELLDFRRGSGSNASTSGGGGGQHDGSGGAGSGGASPRRPNGRSAADTAAVAGGSTRRSSFSGGGDGSGGTGGAGMDGSGGASGRSAILNSGLPGSLSLPANLSTLGTMDGVGAGGSAPGTLGSSGAAPGSAAAAAGPGMPGSVQLPAPPGPGADPGESVEWVNMCWRKVWRVYQRGLERWIIDLLQPVFDSLVKDGSVPRWLCRLRVVELTLDHEAPYFSNMRRRNSRKDSDLNGVVDLRYTGGARMLLMLELGEGRWRFKVPVLVSDLDLECQMWLKLRLAPMCPWIGTISLAFVGPPNVKVQLSPYNRVRLMRVPVVQNYLRKLLTVDLPGLMVLPQRLEINIPPSVTTIAEAAVGRDTIMRAVASAVLQADAVEAALLAALPLGPQTPAGGVTLPEAFKGELGVTLREARNLPVWGFPGQSNPYCRLVLGISRREGDTSHPGRHRAPVWNQEFQFLVEDPQVQVLELLVKDSHLTGRTEVGRASIKLADVLAAQHGAEGGKAAMWIPLSPPVGSYAITGGEGVPTGDVLLELSYKAFDDDEQDSGYREAEQFSRQAASQAPITDIRSAAAASSRAAVAASAAVSAIAMTRAAAARAAARAARAAQEAAAAAAGAAKGAVDQGASIIAHQQQASSQQQQQRLPAPALPPPKQLPAGSASTSGAAATDRSSESTASATASGRSAEPAASASVVERAVAGRGPAAAGADGAAAAPAGGVDRSVSAADLAHVVAAPPSPVHRVRVPAVDAAAEEEENVVLSGGAAKVSAVAEEAQPMGLAATAMAVTTAVPLSAGARSATAAAAVLERPPAVDVHGVVETISGGGGGNGHSYNGYTAGGAEGSPGSRWRQRKAAAGNGGGAASFSHSAAALHNDNGTRADDGDGAAAAVAVQIQVLDLPGQQDDLPAGAAPASSSLSPSSLPASQRRQDEQPPIDIVAAEVVASGGGTQSAGGGAKPLEAQGPQGPAAPAPAPAAGGPVLSALAHLTASAHALTATAIDKARESLSQKQQSPPAQQQQHAKDRGDGDGSGGGGGGGGANWLEAIASRLPWYGSRPQEDEAPAGEGSGSKARREADDGAAAAATGGGDAADEDHPWWQFWVPKGGTAKLYDTPAETDGAAGSGAGATEAGAAKAGASDAAAAAASEGGRGKPWWQFWPDGEQEEEDALKGQRRGEEDAAGGSKPVEAIYIPPDLPLEEIAAEVQRLKEDSWRERSDHVSSLWMKAVERNDRKWLMLAAFLLSVAVGLLTVVAWRLEQLEHLQAAAPQIALMTMQVALQVLEQQSSGGSGLL